MRGRKSVGARVVRVVPVKKENGSTVKYLRVAPFRYGVKRAARCHGEASSNPDDDDDDDEPSPVPSTRIRTWNLHRVPPVSTSKARPLASKVPDGRAQKKKKKREGGREGGGRARLSSRRDPVKGGAHAARKHRETESKERRERGEVPLMSRHICRSIGRRTLINKGYSKEIAIIYTLRALG